MEQIRQPEFGKRACHKYYKYLNFEDSLKVISQGTLMFTKPTNFNDPFDCYPYLPAKGWEKVYKRLNAEFGLEKKASKKLISKNLQNMRQTGKDGVLHRLVSNNLAITCFSATPLSVPMWAHYANQHTGCVIEFQSSDDIARRIAAETPDMMYIHPFYVNYTDERPPLYDKDGTLRGLEVAFSKSSQWSYEEEVRAYSFKDGIHNFSRHQITKVFTGLRMDEANKRAVREAVASMKRIVGNRCKVTELSMSFNNYEFVSLD